jgi:hypothetical protein
LHRIRPCQLFAEWLQLKLRQRAIHSPFGPCVATIDHSLEFHNRASNRRRIGIAALGPRINHAQADKKLLEHALPPKLNTEQHAPSHQHRQRIHLSCLFSLSNDIRPIKFCILPLFVSAPCATSCHATGEEAGEKRAVRCPAIVGASRRLSHGLAPRVCTYSLVHFGTVLIL